MTKLFMEKKDNQVTIVDSIMGSGKTSWAIQFMKENIETNKFLFVTPYLTEIERIIEATQGEFKQPESSREDRKLESLKSLIRKGEQIVTTHELLKRSDSELIELIDLQGYTLILDEVIGVIEEQKIGPSDVKLLLDAKDGDQNYIDVGPNGIVKWNMETYKNGMFQRIRNKAKTGNIILFEEKKMYWLFPQELIEAFQKVYVLTYLFKGQLQYYYFQMMKITMEFKAVAQNTLGYHLIDYQGAKGENRQFLAELIRIHYDTTRGNKLNTVGDKPNSFSVSDLAKQTKKADWKKLVRNNAYTFFRHRVKVDPENVIWTTFGDYQKLLQPDRLSKAFLSVNARATNEYAHTTCCIYLANRYMNPILKRFFEQKGLEVDEKLFALSELIQWLFRSAIRNEQSIDLYIPSVRMRTLLEQYLKNEI